MAEPTQFTFSMVEATEALIKKQGIHEGKWMLAVEFVVNVALLGTGPNDARPGAMVLANSLQLVKAPETGAPANLIVDAAEVNPAKATKVKA
jgi:hypothetical protein